MNQPLSEHLALELVIGREAALRVSPAPGGWRTLSTPELVALGLSVGAQRKVLALQELVRRGYPELPRHQFLRAEDVGRVYGERLGGLEYEVVIAIAVDGKNRLLLELEVASGGLHGASLTPCDVLRPLIRAGASAFLLVHNHPSGDPTPSREDIAMTLALSRAGVLVGVPLLDHVVVAARGGGFASLAHLIESGKDGSEHVATTESGPRTH